MRASSAPLDTVDRYDYKSVTRDFELLSRKELQGGVCTRARASTHTHTRTRARARTHTHTQTNTQTHAGSVDRYFELLSKKELHGGVCLCVCVTRAHTYKHTLWLARLFSLSYQMLCAVD
jgi:hypothetical protein